MRKSANSTPRSSVQRTVSDGGTTSENATSGKHTAGISVTADPSTGTTGEPQASNVGDAAATHLSAAMQLSKSHGTDTAHLQNTRLNETLGGAAQHDLSLLRPSTAFLKRFGIAYARTHRILGFEHEAGILVAVCDLQSSALLKFLLSFMTLLFCD